jgi:hypothetical protein
VKYRISAWFTDGRQSSVATVQPVASFSVHSPVPSKSFESRERMRRALGLDHLEAVVDAFDRPGYDPSGRGSDTQEAAAAIRTTPGSGSAAEGRTAPRHGGVCTLLCHPA